MNNYLVKTQTATERPFAIGDQIEWDGDDGAKHTGQVRSMGDPGVTTDNAWLPWNTKGLRKIIPASGELKERLQEFTRVNSNEAPEPTGHRLLTIPLHQVTPSPQNPRGQASMGDLQALANDIRTQGQINPITVRQLDASHFEVITGERRFRACALAELPTILAINRGPISLEEALVERIRENAQREQLTPLEEAKAIEFLLSAGKSPAEAAIIMGKSESWVSLTRNLGRMPGEAQDLLAKGRITRSVAEALFPLMLWPKVLVEYARHAVSQGWSSRTVQTEVTAKVDVLKREEQRRNNPPEVTVTITTKRTETQSAGRINFDDDDEDETLDIPAGERTAQEALANESETPAQSPEKPVVTPEEAEAAKAKLDHWEALRDRYTDLCDVLWAAVNEAGIAGTDCLLLTEIEAMVRNYTGDPFSEEETTEEQADEVEFTIDGADEETDE